MTRFQTWLDGTGFHHRWMANGPLWFLCSACRESWGGNHPGFWRQFRHAATPTWLASRRNARAFAVGYGSAVDVSGQATLRAAKSLRLRKGRARD